MTEFLIICDQESNNNLAGGIGSWPGAAASSKVLVAPKRSVLITMEAENAAEAARGVKSLFPSWTKTKLAVVEKGAVEEL